MIAVFTCIGCINTLRGVFSQLKRKEIRQMAETTKQETKRLFADVPKEYAFYCRDGQILRNMKELGDT